MSTAWFLWQQPHHAGARNLGELKKQLLKVWADFKMIIVDRAIDQWRKLLQTCVKAKGQHFEQLL